MRYTKSLFTLFFCLFVATSAVSLVGCSSDGPAEKAGAKVDQAVESATEATEQAVEQTSEHVEEMVDEVKDTADHATE
ncbi:antitoxin [Desulfogranum japonicum]|uniref:antitoxin n=1 Tax=Desulfogranum japonicum TaxID=231447 RepID=UPI00040DBB29|nr:antitoxin [Desulfogranum japonicum]